MVRTEVLASAAPPAEIPIAQNRREPRTTGPRLTQLGVALVSIVVAMMTSGLVLGWFGLLRPGPFAIVAVVGAYTLYAVWVQGNRRRGALERTPPGMAVGATIAALASLALAVAIGMTGQSRPLADGFEAGHVLTATSAAKTGELEHGLDFTTDPSVDHAASGLRTRDGSWTVPRPRGWTVMLTASHWLGERGQVLAAAAMAGLSVFLLYGLAAQRLRPETALLLAVAFGLSPVLWLSARGMSAAPAAAVITLGALWLLVAAASDGSYLQGAVAGVAVGAAAMVSYEGWLLSVAAWAFLMTEEAGAWGDSLLLRRRSRRFALAVVAGSAPFLALAGIDLVATGRVSSVMLRFVPAVAVVVAGGALLRIFWNTGLKRGFAYFREVVLLVSVALAAAATYRLLRDPGQVEVVRQAALGLATGEAVHTLPTAATKHLVFGWLRLHVGFITMLLGATGLVWMGLASTVTRDPGLRVPMLATLIAGGLTLALPLGVPIQPDGLGVLLPMVVPGLLLGAGFVIDRWWDRRGLGFVGALVAGVALLVVPGWRLQGGSGLLPQDGANAGVLAICDRLPPDAAVLVIEGDEAPSIGRLLMPAVRSLCDVPAAYATTDMSTAAFERFEGVAGEAGKSLYVLANEPFPLGQLGPGVAKSGDFVFESWRSTVTAFPTESEVVSWPIGVGPAP